MIEQDQRRPVAQYVLCYTLFAVLMALSIVVIFGIWNNTLAMLVKRYVEKPWAYNAYQNFGLIGLTVLGFVLVMAAEPYLRHGVERNKLLPRFGKLALPLVLAGAAGLLLQIWAQL